MALISINNTKAAYNIFKRKLDSALRFFSIVVHIAFMLLYVYYLIFNNANFNILIYSILLAVDVVSFVFIFLFNVDKNDDARIKFKKKKIKVRTKNILNIFKYAAKIFSVVYTLIYISKNGATDATKYLTYASAIITVLLMVYEFITYAINKYIDLFIIAFEKDLNESALVNAKRGLDKFIGASDGQSINTNYSKAEEKMINKLNEEIGTMGEGKPEVTFGSVTKNVFKSIFKSRKK